MGALSGMSAAIAGIAAASASSAAPPSKSLFMAIPPPFTPQRQQSASLAKCNMGRHAMAVTFGSRLALIGLQQEGALGRSISLEPPPPRIWQNECEFHE